MANSLSRKLMIMILTTIISMVIVVTILGASVTTMIVTIQNFNNEN